MEHADARIARKTYVRAELKRMGALGPGKIIQQIVNRQLEAVTVVDALVERVDDVPWLLCVADESRAFPGVSPMKRVSDRRANYCGVTDCKSLTVIYNGLLGRRTWEKRSLRIRQILHGAAPEQHVFAVVRQVIVNSTDKHVVVEAHRRGESEAGKAVTVAHALVVGNKFSSAEGRVKVTWF